MEQGKGLREFRVGPLPPGSLDRMLADVGYAERWQSICASYRSKGQLQPGSGNRILHAA
jgi:hypothetical protein